MENSETAEESQRAFRPHASVPPITICHIDGSYFAWRASQLSFQRQEDLYAFPLPSFSDAGEMYVLFALNRHCAKEKEKVVNTIFPGLL